MTDEYKIGFKEWYSWPVSERRHRCLLHLARIEQQMEEADERDRERFVREAYDEYSRNPR